MLNTIFAAYYAIYFTSIAYLMVSDYYELNKPKKEVELTMFTKKEL